MAEKTIKTIRESIIREFEKDFPEEKVYGKVFSLYLLDRYATLMFKIYERAKK